MIIGRILSPVHSLGPGERVCVWTQGCSKNCNGCISKDLQPFSGEDIPEELLAQIIRQIKKQGHCSGLTISGGDPFEQPAALLALLKHVRNDFDDILVYTGFTLDEILKEEARCSALACLQYIDVLIDGRYQRSLNKPDCILRGSVNQTIHYLNPSLEPGYKQYMRKGRILETFEHSGKAIITGILNEEESG